jgi:hypothetical protein
LEAELTRGRPVAPRPGMSTTRQSDPELMQSLQGVELPDLASSLEPQQPEPGRFRSVALPLLLPGTLVTLNTGNTSYRMEVVNGSQRRVRISGGKLFPESTEAELIGATDDEGVKVGWIVEGFQLELLTDRGPVLTSVVDSVAVE